MGAWNETKACSLLPKIMARLQAMLQNTPLAQETSDAPLHMALSVLIFSLCMPKPVRSHIPLSLYSQLCSEAACTKMSDLKALKDLH